MSEWWDSLSGIQQFFYYIAIPSTIVMLLQFFLSILGLDGESDVDTDIDVDGVSEFDLDLDTDTDIDVDELDFKFVSFRGIIAFLTIFGWVGLTLISYNVHIILTLFISFICGLIAMATVGAIFYFVGKLQSNGVIRYNNSLGHTGEVYIPIPPKGEGTGKVQLLIQERLTEVEAISSDERAYKTGEIVRVIDVFNNSILVVEKE